LIYCDIAELAWGGCDYTDNCYCELVEATEETYINVNGQFMPATPVTVGFGQLFQLGAPVYKYPKLFFDIGPYGWEGRNGADTIGKRSEESNTAPYSNSKIFYMIQLLLRDRGLLSKDVEENLKSMKRGTQASGVSITWDQPTRAISVFTSFPGHTRLYIRKQDMNKNFPCDLNQNDFILDEDWVATTESIFYQIYVNTSIVDSGTLATRKVKTCDIPDCIFCADVADAWSCFTTPFKTMTVLFYFFFALCIILGLVVAWLILKGTLAGYNIKVQMPSAAQVTQAVIMWLAISATLVGACDASVGIQSSNFVCTNLGDYRTCVLNEQVLATVPMPGYTICYDLINKVTNNVEGRLITTYIEMLTVASTNVDYYTSAYNIHTESIKICPAHSQCTTGNDCNTARSGEDLRTQNGTLTGSELGLPGPRGCLSTCGCAGCNCGVCDEACIYYGAGMEPIKPFYKVQSVTSIALKPSVKVCFVQNNETSDCQTVQINTGGEIDVNDRLSVQFLGSLAGSTDVFGTNKFITNLEGGDAYYGFASPPSAPQVNTIGDIQAATSSGLQNPTYTSFIWNVDILDPYDSGENSVAFTTSANGINLLQVYPKLPHQIGTTIWHFNGNAALEGVNENPGSLLLNIKAVNYTFQQVVDQVCPVMKSHSITGSYQSDGGATWVVFASSDCGTGSCVLTVDTTTVQLTRSSLRLYKDQTFTYIVNFTAALKEGCVTMTCTAGLNKESIHDCYKLDDPHTIINPNGTTPSVTPGTPTDGGGGITFDLGKWLGFGIGGFFMIFFIVAAVVFLLCMLKPGGYQSISFSNPKYRSSETFIDDQGVQLTDTDGEAY